MDCQCLVHHSCQLNCLCFRFRLLNWIPKNKSAWIVLKNTRNQVLIGEIGLKAHHLINYSIFQIVCLFFNYMWFFFLFLQLLMLFPVFEAVILSWQNMFYKKQNNWLDFFPCILEEKKKVLLFLVVAWQHFSPFMGLNIALQIIVNRKKRTGYGVLALPRNTLFGWQWDTVCTRGDKKTPWPKENEYIDFSLWGCVFDVYEHKWITDSSLWGCPSCPCTNVYSWHQNTSLHILHCGCVNVWKRKLGVIVDIVINTSGPSCVVYLGIILRSQEALTSDSSFA